MKFLLNDKIIQSGQSFDEISMLLNPYNFTTTIPEDYPEIIFHGKTQLEHVHHRVVIHIYFDKDKKKLQGMVIHPFPINFDKIQGYLEEQFGPPDIISSKVKVSWDFEDGQIVHQIADRFGDEETIYLRFTPV